jgi:hypothetical protein
MGVTFQEKILGVIFLTPNTTWCCKMVFLARIYLYADNRKGGKSEKQNFG